MGRKHPDRWPAETWRKSAPTVGRMRAAGWDVISYCRTCTLTMRVDLTLVERVSGPDAVLWNRQSACKRIGCDGLVEFQGKPPELSRHLRLFSEWPDDSR